MPKPTQSQSSALHKLVDAPNKALSVPGEGGPMYQRYATPIEVNREFVADHPRYPDYVYPDDQEADTQWAAKDALVEGTGANFTYQLGPKDVQYLLNKKEAQEAVRFKQFVEDSIPRGTPWAKEFFEKIMPGWYQSKIDVINDKLSIVQKLTSITIHGPQTIDDMALLYQVYSGRIDIPQNFEELIRPDSQGLQIEEFKSGLFNPKRFVRRDFLISKRNQEYMANFAIPGIDPKGMDNFTRVRLWPEADGTANAVTQLPFPPYQPYTTTGAAVNPGFPSDFFLRIQGGNHENPAVARVVNEARNDARVQWDRGQPAPMLQNGGVPVNWAGMAPAARQNEINAIDRAALTAEMQNIAGPAQIAFPAGTNVRGIRTMRKDKRF